MKISEFSTDKALDVFCEITPYINSVASDDELLSEIKRKVKLSEGAGRAELIAVGVEKANKLIPLLLKKKRNDIYGILSALNGKSVEEIGKQSFLTTAGQINEVIRDKELIDFFKSCVAVEKNE